MLHFAKLMAALALKRGKLKREEREMLQSKIKLRKKSDSAARHQSKLNVNPLSLHKTIKNVQLMTR